MSGRVPVLLSDALAREPTEGAAVVAHLLAARVLEEGGEVVGPPGDVPPGAAALLGSGPLPWRSLLHLLRALRGRRPSSVTYLPLGGLSWTVLLRAVLTALVLRVPVTLLMLQRFSEPPRWLVRPVRRLVPVLAANEDDVLAARRLGFDVAWWDPPVDPARVARTDRARARELLGLDPDVPVRLHVGHATPGRNLADLAPLAEDGLLVLVLSPRTPVAPDVLPAGPGVRVLHERVDVASWYAAADAYVFPTTDRNSVIGVPMSIAEAVANDLPVVARRSAMTARWAGHAGVQLVDSAEELVERARALSASTRGHR